MRAAFETRIGTTLAMLAMSSAMGIVVGGCDSDTVGAGNGGRGVYAVTIGITNDSESIASIAIDLRHSHPDGDFVTVDGKPDCEILAPGAFGVISVLDPDRLRIGVASFVGFGTPAALAHCRFTAPTAVAANDFSATVVDAVAADGEPPSPAPEVAVTAVSVFEPGASTTTSLPTD